MFRENLQNPFSFLGRSSINFLNVCYDSFFQITCILVTITTRHMFLVVLFICDTLYSSVSYSSVCYMNKNTICSIFMY